MGQVCEWSGVTMWEGTVYEARLQGRKGGRIVRWHGRRDGNVMKWQFGKGGRVVSRESGMEFKNKIELFQTITGLKRLVSYSKWLH